VVKTLLVEDATSNLGESYSNKSSCDPYLSKLQPTTRAVKIPRLHVNSWFVLSDICSLGETTVERQIQTSTSINC